jgi:GT2 family glycosyltransferase
MSPEGGSLEAVDVVVAVYKGAAQTRRCLDSLRASPQRTPFEVVVVDDASPEPEIVAYLDALAHTERVTLLRNDANVGFVRSVNRAMALHEERDVVLLNSDTEVANDWLDRLAACAASAPDVATATPFSNNATICSYPFAGWTGGVPGALGLAALDRIFATVNARRCIDLPTGVGSCMYIRRACLRQIGAFDAERFGRGYGEENDFCLRAAAAGWRNVLAGDVFIFHEGGVSFSSERDERAESALQALLDVHPDYLERVHDFALLDPPSALRDAIDAARAVLKADEARAVLAERAAHNAHLRGRLAEVEKLAGERAAVVAALRAGLTHAEALVAERDAATGERDDEIARLRAGLAHAEKLAFDRAAELERIRDSWLWRYVAPLVRKWG